MYKEAAMKHAAFMLTENIKQKETGWARPILALGRQAMDFCEFKARLGYPETLFQKKEVGQGRGEEGRERKTPLTGELLFMHFPCSVSPCIWGAGYLVLAPLLTVHKIMANPNESGWDMAPCVGTRETVKGT